MTVLSLVPVPDEFSAGHAESPAGDSWTTLLGLFERDLQLRNASGSKPAVRAYTANECQLVEVLDTLGLPESSGRRVAMRALVENGHNQPGSGPLDAACQWRRTRPDRSALPPITELNPHERKPAPAFRMEHLRRFSREVELPPSLVEQSTVLDYLRKPSWSHSTRKAQRASLSDLFSWALFEGHLSHDPTAELPPVASIEPLPDSPGALPDLTPAAARAVEAASSSSVEHPARSWARATGFPLAARGRLSGEILGAWRRAGSPVLGIATCPEERRWEFLLDAYNLELAARGLRPQTVGAYLGVIWRFARGTGADPTAVDRELLVQYLSNPAWEPETRRHHRSVLSLLFEWTYESGRLPYNPARKLPRVRVPAGVPRPAPEPMIRDAINTARPDVRIMILLGAMAGLRRAEIAALRVDSITDEGLYVVGKGGKGRLIPLHPSLAAEIDAYRSENGVESGYLFRHQDTLEPYTIHHIGSLISKRLPAGWSAHKLRHRFATKAYSSQYDIRAVQELLGHASPAVTARYVAMPTEALVDAVLGVPFIPGIDRSVADGESDDDGGGMEPASEFDIDA